MEKLNPQQAATPNVPEVTDPAGFKTDLKVRAATIRDGRFASSSAVQASPVSLSAADLTDVTTIAKARILATYPSFVTAGPLETVRSHFKYIPSDPGTAPAADELTMSPDSLTGLDFGAARTLVLMDSDEDDPDSCGSIIARYHVLTGGRDSGLFEEAIQAILDAAPAKWRTIALSVRGFDSGDQPALQRHIKQAPGETEPTTRRRGRWMNVGTAIHEMLHAVTNPQFESAMSDTENRALGVEGFTEYFTREVYDKIRSDSAGDAALRTSIEGAPGPPVITPPPRDSYSGFYDTVVEIKARLGNNEENLRQAYFRGRLEYIGLGRWNEIQRGLRRHELGAAVLLRANAGTLGTPAYLRADWGYLVLGYTGDVQLDLRLGAGLTFITEGSRIGLGPQVSGTIRGSHLFLSGGGLIQGSTTLSGPGQSSIESIFNLAAGVNFGHFQVGPTVHVLVPITHPAMANRTVDVFAGIGVSFILGQ